MIHMKANTRRAAALSDDLITTGSVGIEVEILCSEAWDGLTKTVLFRGSGSSVDVILTGDSCTVPPEVLTVPGGELLIGLYGTDGSGSLAIPTVWADAGRILQGAAPSGIAPTPAQKSALDQAIEALQNATEEIPEQIDTALAEAKASGEFDGDPGDPGPKGDRGDDGISPDVSVTAITGGHRVTIVDADNTYVFDVMDGDPGAKGDRGDDGISPEVSVTTITGGHRVTITDADGTNVFDVMDGPQGDPGDPGVYVGPTAPTDPSVRVWIDTSGDPDETDVFWATYNTTTEAEVTAAVTAGKTVLCKISDEIFYLTQKASVGPSGTAWIFASVGQSSIRVTFVSGSYWNSISTKTIPSKTSDLTNDSGFITGYTETDPTVPSWAKASSKPSYTASEVGAIAAPSSPATGAFLVWNGTAWVAQTMSAWQGGNY